MSVVAVVGAGLIGRAWAIGFARAGHEVRLFDETQGAAAEAKTLVSRHTRALRCENLPAHLAPFRLVDRSEQLPDPRAATGGQGEIEVGGHRREKITGKKERQ